MSSGLDGLTRHDYLRLHEVIVGSEYKRRNDRRYHYHNGADGGNLVNSILDDFGSEGGVIKTDCLIHVDDEHINLEACDGGLILEGTGRFNMTDNPAVYFNTYARSGFRFDGFHFTSALAAVRRGRITIRNMALGFTGITSDHLIPADYIYYDLDGLLVQEWSNTFATGEGILTPIGAAPTPTTTKTIVKDCFFHMRSNNCVAIGPHNENLNVIRPTFSFQGADQIGVSIKGVGIQSIEKPLIWLASGADGCVVFEVYNQVKHGSIHDVSGSHQVGGVTGPCALLGVYGSTYTNDQINCTVHNINGDIEKLLMADATDFALWENAYAQAHFLISGELEGYYISPLRPIPVLSQVTPINIPNPGTSYVVVDTALTRKINLDYAQHVRVCGKAQGNEADAGKGICMYNITNGEVLAEHIWDGSAVEEFDGPWTNVVRVGDIQGNIYIKGATITEDFDLWSVWLELR